MLVDTHCHLNFDVFDDDRDDVVGRAREFGVVRILNPGIDLTTSQAALDLAEKYPEVYAAVGVHPNDANAWGPETLDSLRELASRQKVVAIGEIGLDYYRDRTPPARQHEVFRAQLELAAELSLPVVIHNRDAASDLMEILREWKMELASHNPLLSQAPGVLHAFSADPAIAAEAVDLGFYLGIAGPVTFPKAELLRDVVQITSLEHLLVETDSPFLTPQQHRGKRNEPAYVRFTASKVAEIHDIEDEIARSIIEQNAGRLFRWDLIE